MTNEEMRIAIAEAVGWQIHPKDRFVVIPPNSPHSVQPLHTIPHYPGDLNAIQAAESTMSVEQWRKWTGIVGSMLFFADNHGNPKSTYQMIAELTAAQRAEAFLRAIGKWNENTNPQKP